MVFQRNLYAKAVRRFFMLSVASMSGEMFVSKTSTETHLSYCPLMSSAAMGWKSTSPMPGPWRLGSLAWKCAREGLADDFRDGSGVRGHGFHVEVEADVG